MVKKLQRKKIKKKITKSAFKSCSNKSLLSTVILSQPSAKVTSVH